MAIWMLAWRFELEAGGQGREAFPRSRCRRKEGRDGRKEGRNGWLVLG
jgi:hypothetical protein